ncbi:hypothetical protein COW46_02220 [Candidatus Gracilibacteria bacterium CG17_big_fil_post_rev_8_21_14_2_50_48_13]|nr:MAG: hypothetical protein COW46_02220 [Candidatus Gracilibacteria bacterium CG17_big_fil_post_rev_8_21_14_2_50_48_13]
MSDSLQSASFSGAKSTGDAEKDLERAEEMVEKVEDILARQETGDMTPPLGDDRGGMAFYCRSCKISGPVTQDVEEEFDAIVCTECGGKVAIGTEMSIRTYFHLS